MNTKLIPLSLAIMLASGTGCVAKTQATKSQNDVYGDCGDYPSQNLDTANLNHCPKLATDFTEEANNAVISSTDGPFSNPNATDLSNVIKDELQIPFKEDIYNSTTNNRVWSREDFDFLDSIELDPYTATTINPSLLRQAKLNNEGGVYKINENIYQVRGYDLSVMSFIKGEEGWIIIDPLTSAETAEKGWEHFQAYAEKVKLVDAQHPNYIPNQPETRVSAIIFTHSHIDHFGGVLGLGVTADNVAPTIADIDVANGIIPVYAPAGFFEHSVSENVLAGTIMSRRASFMYGNQTDPGIAGNVDGGLGKTTSTGAPGILEPTVEFAENKDGLDVDSILFDVQMANGSEAPSEFMFYIRGNKNSDIEDEYSALMAAEVMTNTMHNLSSLRGAKTRDAKAWADYVDAALMRFGSDAKYMIASHHWPTMSNSEIVDQLEKTRDGYKYIHDQVLRLANNGYTPNEISSRIKLPPTLNKAWYNRDYYGTLSHNSRATYDFYLGAWWDGNPANLNPLPPAEEAELYIGAFGGKLMFEKAKDAVDAGNYRGAVRLLNHIIFAGEAKIGADLYKKARYLSADAMEQMGYQAESGPWRNYYLAGALELRSETPLPVDGVNTSGITSNMPTEMALDSLATHVNSETTNIDEGADTPDGSTDGIVLEGKSFLVDYTVTEGSATNQYYQVFNNSVLKTYKVDPDNADKVILGNSQSVPWVAPSGIATTITLNTTRGDLQEIIASVIKKGPTDDADCSDMTIPGTSNVSNLNDLKDFCRIFEGFKPDFSLTRP